MSDLHGLPRFDPSSRYSQFVVNLARSVYEQKSSGPAWLRYPDEPIEFITKVLRQHRGNSWRGWRIILKAAYCKPLDEEELEFFREVSGGRNPPTKRVRELWCLVGRRGGKDSTASVIATEAARLVDTSRLRPGEEPLVACLANTKEQAEIVWRYIKGYFEIIKPLQPWLKQPIAGNTIRLKNGVQIKVATNNYRAPRGWPIACAILDEVAYYRSDESATPDTETYNALKPGMLTIKGSMLIGISSPYKKSGLLFNRFEEYYGKDSDDVLVIKAETRLLNPEIEELYPGEIAKAYEEDPERAAAEYGAEFRSDLADYVDRDIVRSCTDMGVFERPWDELKRPIYRAFVDPSGGSRDSFALAIAHYEPNGSDGKGVLDCLREVRAPFIPAKAVEQLCDTLKEYRVSTVTGDRYAGEWPKQEFATHGVKYEPTEVSKSDMYRDFLPLMNSGKVRFIENNRMFNQYCQLEARTVRGGRDSIDHPVGGMDDLANAATGALLQVAGTDRSAVVRRYLLGG
jgi:hypothetical protein